MLLKELDKESQKYITTYFENAPEWLLEEFQVVRLAAEKTFIHEGESADNVFILVKGSVMAVDYRVQEMVYGFIKFQPIEVFGAMEIMINMNHYKTTLMTKTESVFLKIGTEKFKKWINNDLQAYKMQTKKVVGYLNNEARRQRLYVMLQGVERVGLVLYDLYESYAKSDKFEMVISRHDLAEMTGLCVRTITRTLNRMEEDGYLTKQGRRILMTKAQHDMLREKMEDKIIGIDEEKN